VRSALNLMVLATVPYMRDTARSTGRLRRRLALGAAGTAVLAVAVTLAWRLLT